jgi:hypothetical protein
VGESSYSVSISKVLQEIQRKFERENSLIFDAWADRREGEGASKR